MSTTDTQALPLREGYWDPAKLLASFRKSGFTLDARDGCLMVSPREKLSNTHRRLLHEHRDALLALLREEEEDFASEHLQIFADGLARNARTIAQLAGNGTAVRRLGGLKVHDFARRVSAFEDFAGDMVEACGGQRA
jgi:hypothetical protein